MHLSKIRIQFVAHANCVFVGANYPFVTILQNDTINTTTITSGHDCVFIYIYSCASANLPTKGIPTKIC